MCHHICYLPFCMIIFSFSVGFIAVGKRASKIVSPNAGRIINCATIRLFSASGEKNARVCATFRSLGPIASLSLARFLSVLPPDLNPHLHCVLKLLCVMSLFELRHFNTDLWERARRLPTRKCESAKCRNTSAASTAAYKNVLLFHLQVGTCLLCILMCVFGSLLLLWMLSSRIPFILRVFVLIFFLDFISLFFRRMCVTFFFCCVLFSVMKKGNICPVNWIPLRLP